MQVQTRAADGPKERRTQDLVALDYYKKTVGHYVVFEPLQSQRAAFWADA